MNRTNAHMKAVLTDKHFEEDSFEDKKDPSGWTAGTTLIFISLLGIIVLLVWMIRGID